MLNSDSKLTKSLLRNARLWGVLSKLLDSQIKTLETLQQSYENKRWAALHEEDSDKLEMKIRQFQIEISKMGSKVRTLLRDLTATSQSLIQLVRKSIPSLKILANLAVAI